METAQLILREVNISCNCQQNDLNGGPTNQIPIFNFKGLGTITGSLYAAMFNPVWDQLFTNYYMPCTFTRYQLEADRIKPSLACALELLLMEVSNIFKGR